MYQSLVPSRDAHGPGWPAGQAVPGRAGPGWPFKARGANGPKTGRKEFQDENKLNMKTKISEKLSKNILFLKISKILSRASPSKPCFIKYILN